MAGTFEDFLDALLAFESGWDRERYNSGVIVDWQLDQWAGGSVETIFPQYSSWSQLTDQQWESMAYKSMNTLGFVGYQFGEALLIDLGYYDDDVFYGNGASTNTWDGSWTGKNGVSSLDEFTTQSAQDVAIREALGHNMKIIEAGLSAAGQSLDDFVGTTRTYNQNGTEVSVQLTLSGILAGAHLSGAYAVVNLLLSDSVAADEFGTSILQYIEQFGGFDTPASASLITYFEDRLTGDEGLGAPGGTTDGGETTANVTAQTADVVIDWAWANTQTITNFDPATDTIFIGWITASDLEIHQIDGNTIFAIPSNGNQQTILQGVSLSDLSAQNFTALDGSTTTKILALVGPSDDADTGSGGNDNGDGHSGGGGSTDDGNDDPQTEQPTTDTPVASGNGTANVTKSSATLVVTWNWGNDAAFSDFDPMHDTIFIDWFGADDITISESDGNTHISIPGNNQTIVLNDIALADLTERNFTIMDKATAAKILSLVGTGNDDQSDGQDGTDDHTHDDHTVPDTAVMHMITLTSPSKLIADFDPSMDMFHIEGGITDALLQITDVPGTGLTITVTDANGNIVSTTTTQNIQLSDLSMANFSIAEQSAVNEVAALLGQQISEPGDNGNTAISYDSDGSNPPTINGSSEAGGNRYIADFNADDIIGFDVIADSMDFGSNSVHGVITNMTPDGELIIDNPWWDDMQILQNVRIADLSITNFGIVGNEHLRQDIGGVLSWETGTGPRDPDTVYIRSHAYGAQEVISNFDPASMKISFLYYGTRERLSVSDTDEGLLISTQPSGQSFLFSGIALADLQPGTLEFHHDQVMEDNLEVPFGFNQEDVTLVSRDGLLTPQAPAGETTDGYQTRDGVMTTSSGSGEDPTPPTDDEDQNDEAQEPVTGNPDTATSTDGEDIHLLTWNWGAAETIQNFNPQEDVFDFGALAAGDIALSENNGDLIIEVLNNGGHRYIVENTSAEDLNADNLTAANWNDGVLDDPGGVFQQLTSLGNDDLM